MYSSPTSNAITWLWITTRGIPGITPWMMSSRLGLVARRHRHRVALAGEADRHPQDMGGDLLGRRLIRYELGCVAIVSPLSRVNRSAAADHRPADPSRACRQKPSPPAPSPAARSAPRRSRPPARSRAPAAAPPAPRRPPRARRTRPAALVGDVHRVDPQQLGGRRDDRRHRHVRLAHDDRDTATRARARSAPTATPPRVASRMQCSSAPAASSSASTAGHSEHVSDSISASRSNSSRASMIAVPCSPIGPDTSTLVARADAVGAQLARADRPRRCRSCRGTCRRRRRVRRPSCRRRRSRRPRRARRVAIASTSARRTSASRPSSRIIETVSASGRAPAMARSLTVPLTASSPIDPPGKRSGLTTKLSVVIASRGATERNRARVAERRQRRRLCERRHEQPLDQRLRRLAAGAVGERDLLVAEPRPLRARGLDDLEHALLAAGGR